MSLRLTITTDDGTELLVIDSNSPTVQSSGPGLEPNNSCLALCTRAVVFLSQWVNISQDIEQIGRPRTKPELE